MSTHILAVKVYLDSSKVTVSDRMHTIHSGDLVTWNIDWKTGFMTGDLLEIELDGASFTGASSIDALVKAVGHRAGDQLPYVFFLKRGSSTTRLYVVDLITPVIPTATDPCLVLDTNGPPPTGGGGGTGHCPQGPKDPSGRGLETPDCP